MSCNAPHRVYKSKKLNANGIRPITFNVKNALDPVDYLTVPCGNCAGCRKQRSIEWGIRCYHESKLHEQNSFVTLSYDRKHLPANYMLNHKHFQDFMKRLRKNTGLKIRYLMCGEYGEQKGRCHYHALLFGIDFPDMYFWKSGKYGHHIYRSETLEKIWGKGECPIGEVTFASSQYVAKYINKPQFVMNALLKKEDFIQPYNQSSRRPGLGIGYLEKHFNEFYKIDAIVIDGNKYSIPRAYDKWMQNNCPWMLKEAKRKRAKASFKEDKNTDYDRKLDIRLARETILSNTKTKRDTD